MQTASQMRQINLQEYQRSGPYKLVAEERDALRRIASVIVEPAEGSEGEYTLTPQSVIGAVTVGDLSVLIEPKIDIPQVLSLACYAIGRVEFQPKISTTAMSMRCPMRWRLP